MRRLDERKRRRMGDRRRGGFGPRRLLVPPGPGYLLHGPGSSVLMVPTPGREGLKVDQRAGRDVRVIGVTLRVDAVGHNCLQTESQSVTTGLLQTDANLSNLERCQQLGSNRSIDWWSVGGWSEW